MSEMYDIYNLDRVDSSKRNLIVFLLDRNLSKEIYAVTYQYIFNILKVLSNDFNLIVIPKNRGTSWVKNYVNHSD